MAIDEQTASYLAQSLDVAVRCGYGREDDIIETIEEQIRDELIGHEGYTMSDGWSDVHEAREEVDGAWGAVFFHRQDVERGVLGQGLMLAYGAFTDGDDHESESLRLAREVCDVLEAEGVPTEWDGSLDTRIHIVPFEWRKRRSTRAPR